MYQRWKCSFHFFHSSLAVLSFLVIILVLADKEEKCDCTILKVYYTSQPRNETLSEQLRESIVGYPMILRIGQVINTLLKMLASTTPPVIAGFGLSALVILILHLNSLPSSTKLIVYVLIKLSNCGHSTIHHKRIPNLMKDSELLVTQNFVLK